MSTRPRLKSAVGEPFQLPTRQRSHSARRVGICKKKNERKAKHQEESNHAQSTKNGRKCMTFIAIISRFGSACTATTTFLLQKFTHCANWGLQGVRAALRLIYKVKFYGERHMPRLQIACDRDFTYMIDLFHQFVCEFIFLYSHVDNIDKGESLIS